MIDLVISLCFSLVQQLATFAVQELRSIPWNVATEADELNTRLKRLQAFVESRESMHGKWKESLVRDLRKVAHRIEDVFNSIMQHEAHISSDKPFVRKVREVWEKLVHWSSLKQMNEEIRSIQAEISNILAFLQTDGRQGEAPKKELQHPLPHHQDSEILGLDESKQKLMAQVIDAVEKNCRTVVVVGPPGSGKTVLANSLYKDSRVNKHFDIKVSARLSPRFDVASVLSHLVSQTSNWLNKTQTGDSMNDLKNHLRGKRYLVLLDDVWSESHWNEIKHALPTGSKGSRVVITTTKLSVARSIAESSGNTHVHVVDGLNKDESWRLFCMKAFHGECPRDLEEVSKETKDKCEGSPIAISAVATLLGRKPRLLSEWIKVRDNLRSEMETDDLFESLKNSIQQCFDDLSADVKSCLLYFSLFPQGFCVEKARLIRLWVAERFANQSGEKPAEEVAEEHLNELIQRHLVIANTDFDGRVKTCAVRNFLHYFLTSKARNEDFAYVVDQSTQPGEDNHDIRRISVSSSYNRLSKRVCTLVAFGSVSLAEIIQPNKQFNNLKVVDFQGVTLYSFPDCVVELVLLRFLSLRGSPIFTIPSSIKKLRYLEFLDLKQTLVTFLPKEICLLQNLRHLLVYHYRQSCSVTFDATQGMEMAGQIGSLRSMQKLTLVKAMRPKSFYVQLGCLTQLQKLGMVDLIRSDGRSLCKSLAKMKRLSVLDLRSLNKSEPLDLDHNTQGNELPYNMLQRVYLKGRLEKLPCWIANLKSVVRIDLRWSKLKTSPINELQGLKTLIELYLADAFVGDKLEFRRNAFQSLKLLEIREFEELSELEVYEGSLQKLEKLILCKCDKLQTLPCQIQRLPQLKMVCMFDMPVALTTNIPGNGKISTQKKNILGNGSLDQSKVKVYVYDASKGTWIEQRMS